MKLFGHPVHIMLIHFPAALLPMDFVCSVLYFYTGETPFGFAAFCGAVGGVLLGWAAIVTGLLDLTKVAASHPGIVKKVFVHGGINSFVLLVYTFFVYAIFKNYPAMPAVTVLSLIIKAVLIGCMAIGNYLGGSLILKDKIAVKD